MESITDEFRFYPLPDDIGHHNIIQLNPEGADERRENVRVFAVASQGHPSDRQHQLDSLPRGAKIGTTIRRSPPDEPAVIDGEIEHLADETVYLDYCVSAVSPAQLQPMIAELDEGTDAFAKVFAESSQPTGPGILVEVYLLSTRESRPEAAGRGAGVNRVSFPVSLCNRWLPGSSRSGYSTFTFTLDTV